MIQVTLTSAIALTSAQKTAVMTALEKKYAQKIELETVVDPQVLGGVSIAVGSELFDSTLKTKLNTIKQALNQQLANS